MPPTLAPSGPITVREDGRPYTDKCSKTASTAVSSAPAASAAFARDEGQTARGSLILVASAVMGGLR